MAAAVTRIIFRDLVQRDSDARASLESEQKRLELLRDKGKSLSDDEKAALERMTAVLGAPDGEVVDALFVATRDLFNDGVLRRTLLNHKNGVLKIGGSAADNGAAARPARDVSNPGDDDVVFVAHVLGILAADQAVPPRVTLGPDDDKAKKEVIADTGDPAYRLFTAAFYSALGEAKGVSALARLVLPILQVEGDRDGVAGSPGEVDTGEFAKVLRGLRDMPGKITQLSRSVNECLDKIQEVGGDKSISNMSITFPELDDITDYQIQAENVEAIGPMICAAMFDELKAFEVVDKLVDLWQQGTLPIGVGDAGRMLYDYWKSAPNRMSDSERRNFYALTMGVPGGNANGSTNRDFNDLWIRFVSSVSSLIRQSMTDQLLRAKTPMSIGQQQVAKAARDLALNLSSHGYGMVNYAARDLQDQIVKMLALLGNKDIMGTYGAHDPWQVIDQIAALELGGARNSARYRTLATCGAIITKWLAQNIKKFNNSTTSLRQIINVDDVTSSNPRTAGKNATNKPTDYDLVNACELWLADTALSEDRIELMSQPRESPAMTSRPVQVPSVARELLEQAIPPGLGIGMGVMRH